MIEDGYLLRSIIEDHFGERRSEFRQLHIMETIFEKNVEIKKKRQLTRFRMK